MIEIQSGLEPVAVQTGDPIRRNQPGMGRRYQDPALEIAARGGSGVALGFEMEQIVLGSGEDLTPIRLEVM